MSELIPPELRQAIYDAIAEDYIDPLPTLDAVCAVIESYLEQVGSGTRNGPSAPSWDLYADDLAQPGDHETPVFRFLDEPRSA